MNELEPTSVSHEVLLPSPEEINAYNEQAHTFKGHWQDPALDVHRLELLHVLNAGFEDALDYIDSRRSDYNWQPAEFFEGSSNKRNKQLYTPENMNANQQQLEGIDTASPVRLWHRSNHDEQKLMWLPRDVDPGAIFNIDYEQLIQEGRDLSPEALSTLFIDGLTEANLPTYARLVAGTLHDSEPAIEFLKRWLGDENSHKKAFERYILESRALNPLLFDRAEQQLIVEGETPDTQNPFSIIVYVSIQEPATKLSHRNSTAGMPEDSVMKRMLSYIGRDEATHEESYQIVGDYLREYYPDQMIITVAEIFENFDMPGSSIDRFEQHGMLLRWAGVLDEVDLYQIFCEVAERFKVFETDGIDLHPEAQQAQEQIAQTLTALQKQSYSLESRRAKRRKQGKPLRMHDPFNAENRVYVQPAEDKSGRIVDFPKGM